MSTQTQAREAMSHEQEIHERVKRESAEKLSKPPIPAGSIVLVQTPGSRETGGVALNVPAIVIGQDDNRDLNLSAFHLGGLFHMRGVSPAAVELVTPYPDFDREKLQTVLEEILTRLDALEAPKYKNK